MKLGRTTKRGLLYILIFIFTLHTTPTLYVNSTFLGEFVGETRIGLLYTLSSILTIFGLLVLPFILRRFGGWKTLMFSLVAEMIALLILAYAGVPVILLGAFIISSLLRSVTFFCFDIFLEHESSTADTGNIRGIYLTSTSIATLLGPLIASFILAGQTFSTLYVCSALFLLPVFFIAFKKLRGFQDKEYHRMKFWPTLRRIWHDRDLYGVTMASFLLHFFYSWMVIYTPIYLNQHMGFTLSETGVIIAIALLPFILFEVTWGSLADKKMGEQELLTLGFIIIAISTAAISFLNVPNLLVWGGLLFITRVGASLIETMTETYLFKKIREEDTDMLSFFRITSPISYIIGPAIATLLFIVVDFKFIFLILGAIMLYGVRYSLMIRDTL